MEQNAAETLALKGLAFLAAHGDALVRFLSQTGLEIADLRRFASEPELLAGVLDFILADDSLVQEFCVGENIPVPRLHAARRALPGAAPERSA